MLLFSVLSALSFAFISFQKLLRANNARKEDALELDKEFFRTNTIITHQKELNEFGNSIRFWIPTKSDIELAKKITSEEIVKKHRPNWTILSPDNFHSYFMQYAFFVDSKGDSIIYINAFCELLEIPTDSIGTWILKPIDWKNKLVRVDDGGDCYWSIVINKSDLKQVRLHVNGVG